MMSSIPRRTPDASGAPRAKRSLHGAAAFAALLAPMAHAQPHHHAHARMSWWEGVTHKLSAPDHLLVAIAIGALAIGIWKLPALRSALIRLRRGRSGD